MGTVIARSEAMSDGWSDEAIWPTPAKNKSEIASPSPAARN